MYLLEYTKGKAFTMVLTIFMSNQKFDKACKILTDKYDNKFELRTTFLKVISKFKFIVTESIAALHEKQNFIGNTLQN